MKDVMRHSKKKQGVSETEKQRSLIKREIRFFFFFFFFFFIVINDVGASNQSKKKGVP